MADYEAISKAVSNAVKREVDKQIKAAYKHGYQRGYSEEYEARQSAVDIAYKRGLNTAWKCVRKLSHTRPQAEWNKLCELFGVAENRAYTIFEKCTASEAIAKIKEYEEKQAEKSYRNNKYYNTFPTSKETADEIKAEYDEETRSYIYTVDDDNDDITIEQAIYNLKRGYGIPHKHKTLTLAIKALKMMKEKRND